jgi:hypothetical protein
VVGIGLVIPAQKLDSSRSPAKIAKRIDSSGLDSRIRPNTSVARWRFSKPNLGRFGVFGSRLAFFFFIWLTPFLYPFWRCFWHFYVLSGFLNLFWLFWLFSGFLGTFQQKMCLLKI